MVLHSIYVHRIFQCLSFLTQKFWKYSLGYPAVQVIEGFIDTDCFFF